MKGLANLSPHVHGTVMQLDVNVNHSETNYRHAAATQYLLHICVTTVDILWVWAMATYHHWLVLLETSLLVGLLPQTVQAQGEQHVNINFIVVQLYYVCRCTLQTISLM